MTIIGILAAAVRRIGQERARRRIRSEARARLAMLDDRLLHDIGLERQTVEDERRQPASRPLGLIIGETHLVSRPIDLHDEGVVDMVESELAPLQTGDRKRGHESVMQCQPS
ncbi:DUF1127 domain-containing protein [Fodinicurvata sp. EGI_FJ10296]|uniref:DUF1127 domain-containing protein n=1 Tax=Fodinicurvata sp. EGI_FJ10296 TaxID=3231908 RepID=UPI003455DE32